MQVLQLNLFIRRNTIKMRSQLSTGETLKTIQRNVVELIKYTLPEFWSGTLKLKIDLSPGAASSTVAVIRN